jgi:hypothetical protein
MKKNCIVICSICVLVIAFTTCSKGTAVKARTSIDAVVKYLSNAKNGASVDDSLPLAVKIDLQNMTADASGWKQLLGAINTAGKYITLDLSGCTMPGTEFNPDPVFDSGKKFIVSLVLPNTAESIIAGTEENSTFQHFVNLTSIPIGKGLASIGDYAFMSNQLTSAIIPIKVTTIGNSVFANNQLTSVTIPNSVTSIGEEAFTNNQLTTVTIPDSVTSIGKYAFSRNQLTSITIPNSVTSIEVGVFSNNQLTNINIPDSITTIGTQAFKNNQLTYVTIPNSVTEIGGDAFTENPLAGDLEFSISNMKITITKYKGNLKDVKIPETIIGLPVISIGNRAFYNIKLTSITIPNSVVTIGERAFAGSRSTDSYTGTLSRVTIPNSVITIREEAFYANQLTNITIPNSITTMGRGVFDGNQITSVTIGANVPVNGMWETGILYEGDWFSYGNFSGHDNGFTQAYSNGGKQAGTYTRVSTNFTQWTKQ